MKTLTYLFSFFLLFLLQVGAASEDARRVFSEIVLEQGEEEALLKELSETGDPYVADLVAAIRGGDVYKEDSDPPVVITHINEKYEVLLTGEAYNGDVSKLEKLRAGRSLRKEFSRIVSLIELASPDYKKRADAALKIGAGQKPEFIPELRERIEKQPNKKLKNAFQEALSLSLLANGTPEEQLASIKNLGELHSVTSRDILKKIKADKEAEGGESAAAFLSACDTSLTQIENYEKKVEFMGTLFRGISTGSVLLIVSYGLAITFGLMGVINMAHGEFIAIGAYTVYVVQNIVLKTFGEGSAMFEAYFLISLPLAFLIPALFGALMERGVIQFLYKRPLESLLATWGISMIIQQVIRLIFGAANVQVSSPEWISGSYDLAGVTITYNRLFVIIFSVVVVFMTWALLRRTRLGLQIRATMQNRTMASNLGMPASKINMLTFAYGSGLAGLAGAFLSQIGNVGASMGQAYIVESFMVVVIGGVGNLMGAAISSLGIGMVDQMLQPLFGPVMGKITALIAIILFLQWKPGGIFPSRSRSLED